MLTYPIALHEGPGPLLAFAPEPDPERLAETMVALANADGGSIVLGVAEDGTPAGAPADRDVDAALDAACARCRPAIAPERRVWSAPSLGALPVIRVPRGTRVYALADGRVLARAGGENRLLNGDAIRRLVQARALGDFEAEPVPGAGADALDPALVDAFVAAWSSADGDPWAGTYAELLTTIGALTPDRRPTVAGMLLFGRDPGHWLPFSGARFVRYLGSGEDRAQRAVDERIGGALVPVIERLTATVREQLGAGADAYPARAVREALINALIHRDYRLRGTVVEVRLYPDRLEVHSPSGLPGFLSIEDLLSARYSRNPRLAWALHQWGYVPEPGRGIRRMCEQMAALGHRPPEFEAAPYRLTVRLYRGAGAAAQPENGAALNRRQREVLAYVQTQGSITFREFRALALGVQPELLQRDLDALVKAGYLRRIGQRVGAYYILP